MPSTPAPTPADAALQGQLRDAGLPRHVAVIMDGNGRWARHRGKGRVHGHREGVKAVRDTVEACAQLGVEVLTLYTFSTENWQRPVEEVSALMALLVRTLRREAAKLDENDIRLVAIGDRAQLPAPCRTELEEALALTEGNRRMTLNLALSYSGRWDLASAARQIAADVAVGALKPSDVDEAALQSRLTTRGLPDPDLLIRTGGDQRISNFLLWEAAYAELVFTDVFWPDFRREHLYRAIEAFQARERRFGRVALAPEGGADLRSVADNKPSDAAVRVALS